MLIHRELTFTDAMTTERAGHGGVQQQVDDRTQTHATVHCGASNEWTLRHRRGCGHRYRARLGGRKSCRPDANPVTSGHDVGVVAVLA